MRSVCIATLVAFATLAGCGDEPVQPVEENLIDEDALTLDIATSAGHGLSLLLDDLLGHEEWASSPHSAGGRANTVETSWTIGRTYKCLDQGSAPVNCLPFTQVRTIVTNGTIGGTRKSQPSDGAPVTWGGVLRHTITDTTLRVFTDGTETARIHNGFEVGRDTTTFVDGVIHRIVSEATIDSVRMVTFQVPSVSPRRPISGTLVRTVAAHVEITKEPRTVSHDFTRRVEITFPADAQGNVALKVGAKTCQLNLSRRLVTNCQ